MAVGAELFKLYGLIGMQGVEKTQKHLKGIDKQIRKTQKEVHRLGVEAQTVGKILTKAFTVPLLIAGAASLKFVDYASDLNETIAKTGEIFGDSAKDIEDWAKSSATKLGQSKDMAMDAAATFAIFGQSTGMAGKDLVKFSTEFVELASDMASFFNTEPSEAITAIGAAFRGENEPIRKYGILLDDATMRQKAFELGLITTTKKALLPQTKILAAQALIMEQSKIAQGDFARTSAGLANQKRILAAQIKNVSASLGQLFLPAALSAGKVISKLVGLAEKLVEKWKSLQPATKTTIKGFVLLAAAIGPAVFMIGKLIAWSGVLIPVLAALKAGTLSYAGAVAILKKSIMGTTLIVTALVALGWYWYANWETLSVQIEALWAKIALTVSKGSAAVLLTISDLIIGSLGMLDKLSVVVPGLSAKIKKATIGLLKFKAAIYQDLGKQQQNTNMLLEQGKATKTLTETVKSATEAAKKALGVKDEIAKKTQLQIDAEKAAAKAAKETAEKIKKYNADILAQTEKIGLDKSELLALERKNAIAEAEAMGADVLAVKALYTAKHIELLDAENVAINDYNEKTKAGIENFSSTKLELLEVEKQAELLKADELGADKYSVAALYALKEKKLKDEIRAEEEAKDKQAIQNRLTQTSSIGNKINGILGKFASNKLQRLNNHEKKELASIENSQMTEEQKEAAVQRVQEATEKKRRVLERERAIREKAAALFNIAINTASAVIEALPNIPLSLFVGGLGAAEAVAVASAPMPFFEGGLIKGSDQGINAQVGEKGQDELIFPVDRGIGLIVDGIVDAFSNIQLPSFAQPELAGVGGGGTTEVHMHLGTFIGDARSLKEFERKLSTVRISENQRKGF